MPDYKGNLSPDKFDASVIQKKDFSQKGPAIGLAVAAMKKAQLSKSSDPALALWQKAHLTKPTPIYNFDDTIYGYLYGVVHGNKLVGHIVAGASREAPPVLEYSTGPGHYQRLVGADRIYFGSATSFLLLHGDVLTSAEEGDVVCNRSDLSALQRANEPTAETQAAHEAAWLDFQEAADSPGEPALVTATDYYVPIDTSDYTYMWQDSCHAVARSMYVDALARRVEPGLFSVGRPHSVDVATWFWNRCPRAAPTLTIKNDLQTYLSSYKATSSLSFTVQIKDSGDGSGTTKTQVFTALCDRITAGWPAVVGWGDTLRAGAAT